MQMTRSYAAEAVTRAAVDTSAGLTLLEFGAPWCGYCQITQPMLEQALQAIPTLQHLKIEDGKGQPLGRSYGIKHWPTLILLNDGVEVARVTRPSDAKAIVSMFAQLHADPTPAGPR